MFCTIEPWSLYYKNNGFVIYGFRGKLVCLSNMVCLRLTLENTLAY
jgi:hypothetical protein